MLWYANFLLLWQHLYSVWKFSAASMFHHQNGLYLMSCLTVNFWFLYIFTDVWYEVYWSTLVIVDMLQNLMKKLMFQRYSESDEEREDKSVGCGDILRSRSRSLPVDDSEVILRRRRHKHEHSSEPEPGKCKQRLRIVSCPDESYLHQLCTDGDIDFKMVDLRKICQEGSILWHK